ncbi:MAG TPA: sigma-70 family RNA polymerase sigma factor, partial [Phototrophicaceae bacterium]|nr:sigma-70 family RNA polymerase sigma factor [Phototrophicaceae bacterium]
RYRVGNNQQAEDLTATTFLKAWRARDQYTQHLSAFSTWVFSIARHVAIDHFRQQRDEITFDSLQTLADDHSLEEAIQRQNEQARLTALLAQLPAADRELIALKYGAELTNRDIAHLTNLSESNVGTRLYRIVRKLRDEWDE